MRGTVTIPANIFALKGETMSKPANTYTLQVYERPRSLIGGVPAVVVLSCGLYEKTIVGDTIQLAMSKAARLISDLEWERFQE